MAIPVSKTESIDGCKPNVTEEELLDYTHVSHAFEDISSKLDALCGADLKLLAECDHLARVCQDLSLVHSGNSSALISCTTNYGSANKNQMKLADRFNSIDKFHGSGPYRKYNATQDCLLECESGVDAEIILQDSTTYQGNSKQEVTENRTCIKVNVGEPRMVHINTQKDSFGSAHQQNKALVVPSETHTLSRSQPNECSLLNNLSKSDICDSVSPVTETSSPYDINSFRTNFINENKMLTLPQMKHMYNDHPSQSEIQRQDDIKEENGIQQEYTTSKQQITPAKQSNLKKVRFDLR